MQGRSLVRASLFIVSALALLAAAGACGYESQYVAPADGRPRVVWGPGNDPAIELAGAPPSPDCAAALRQITGREVMPTMTGSVELPSAGQPGYVVTGGVWTPRYYGPPIYIGTPGLAPRFLRPPIFSPSLFVARTAINASRPRMSSGLGGGGIGGGGGGGFRIKGGSGGGGGGDAGKGLLILAALAIMVIPAVDIGVAAARPESSTKSAQATDLVNAYNDLMRSPGSPCSVYDAPPPSGFAPDPSVGVAPGGVQ